MKHWTVLKFGGTSVARARHWRTIEQLARQRRDAGHRVVLVCSALAGVTNALQALAICEDAPEPAIDEILQQHADLANLLGVNAAELLQAGRRDIETALTDYRAGGQDADLARLLATGEWLSSRLGQGFLAQGLEADWVDARSALTTLPEIQENSRRAWLSARCAARPDPDLQTRWSGLAPVLVTQGFIARGEDGATRLLGRGGSDTSAALLAAALQADTLEIWTDVPGLFSADPRLESDALLIRELDYAEALELAASGAKVVHPRAIRAAAEAGTPVQVRDLAFPDLLGTRISGSGLAAEEGIKAVTCQQNMLVLLLENLDTRQQVGFLAEVFRIISLAGVSVDLVATSETTTTLAINAAANHLDDAGTATLIQALAACCSVTRFSDCSCVNLVGRGARSALARLGPSADFFRDRPLLMLSQSANDLSISLLVEARDAGALVSVLHDQLIGGSSTRPATFGPTWAELKAGG